VNHIVCHDIILNRCYSSYCTNLHLLVCERLVYTCSKLFDSDTNACYLLYSEVHMCSHRHVIATSCAMSLQSCSDEILGKLHHCLMVTDPKQKNNHKRWYYSPSHCQNVNVMLSNITFLWFLLFFICRHQHSGWSFVFCIYICCFITNFNIFHSTF